MIQLDSLSKAYGGRVLFNDLTWTVPERRRVGLVGPNGVGKSTLFKIIAGHEEADAGRVVVPRDCRLGYLPQELTRDEDGTLLDIVLRGRRDLLEMEAKLAALEAQLGDEEAPDHARRVDEYGHLQDVFRRSDGYAFRSRAREIAVGIGFTPADFERPIETFSGGWQMRALLCRLLLQEPDVLLLDEPTNHLDIESLEWLESYLGNYPGTVIIISHDRYFLNRLVEETAEMQADGVNVYKGNYDAYLEQRAARREQLVARAEQQRKEIEHLERFVERFRYKATKAAQAQSRLKQLEKIEVIEVPPDAQAQIAFEFPQPPRTGKVVVDARGLTKAYGEHVIYDGLDFQLHRGDRVALVGPNGAGKTTLLKMLAGALAPDAGTIELGAHVDVTYFAQHALDRLDLSRTIYEEMNAAASFDAAPRVRSILGAFLFRGDDVDKRISVLSGGEKSRLALAKMLLEPAGCLLLDEPTNHLDIPSVQVLEHALKRFEGAFCVVSHDRYFLNEVVNKVIHIEDGTLTVYDGNYDYYRWKRAEEQRVAAPVVSAAGGTAASGAPAERALDEGAVSRKDVRRLTAELRKRKQAETRELRAQFEAIERQIEALEAKKADLEARLADPATYENGTDIGELNQAYGSLEEELDALMMRWEECGAALEAIEARYAVEEENLRQG